MNMFSKPILLTPFAREISKTMFLNGGYISKFRNLACTIKFGCPCEPMKNALKNKSLIPLEDCKRDLLKATKPKQLLPSLEKPRPKPALRRNDGFMAELKFARKWYDRRNQKIRPTRRKRGKLDLEGCNVAISGGFGSIGQATCMSLLDRDVASVAILDIKENPELIEGLKKAHPDKKIYFQPMDVTKKSSVEDAFNAVEENVKDLDVFINCSGVLCDTCPEKTVGVNLLGTVYTTLTAMERMGKHNGHNGGLIVNVACVLGLVPCNAFAIYSSSKHGQIGFTRSLADDYYFKRTGVKLMLACPGITESALIQDPEGSTTFPYAAVLGKQLVAAEAQSPEVCGENIVNAMEKDKNGSVWILDLGKYYEVKPIQYWVPLYDENTSPGKVEQVKTQVNA